MTRILAIDPSKRATGLALVDTSRVRLVEQWVIAGGRSLPDHTAEQFIAARAEDIIRSSHPDAVAIEVPTTDNAQLRYRRQDGSSGARAVTSASQWRLIGRLLQIAERYAVVLHVPPHAAKQALGLSGKAQKATVLSAAQAMVGKLPGCKYERETIADCIGIALAGSGILAEQWAIATAR